MEQLDLLIKARRAILPDGERPAAIGIRNGHITAVTDFEAMPVASKVVTLADDEVLMPGLVDSHVHICEPGNTEWEGFLTATRAAAAGGITTLVDMPLDSVPTTVSLAALAAKRAAAEGQCHVDVGFWGGAIPSNLADLPALHFAGVLGFKSFLCDTGTDDFPHITPRHMKEVMRVVRELGSIFIVHAESNDVLAAVPAVHTCRYSDYLASRPRGAENLAIAEVIEAARVTGARAHVLHLSSADALPMIASAIADGVHLSVETCPHYLVLCAEEIPDGATAAKVGPPVRERSNREKLWDGLRDGTLSMIVSDHSPCTPAMKELDSGDFGAAWGGISSLQLGLPVAWSEARARGHSLVDIASWMALKPAALAGLERKGRLAIGCDADFSIFAPEESFVVEAGTLHHRHRLTPYLGHSLYGAVRQTYLAGRPVDLMGRPRGKLLSRAEAQIAENNANTRKWG
ncbi:allantoinase AllB [Sinorhizobium mexicanum]|uniref:allantoinase n=1 Tax=Sinorhizobium mexicanum TaxID=375549 RepID=A0A859QCK5_9HYPH|nr:allantoinase AllB [Sinorhizobium mexicanum]MBP1882466.1 allantoinase [Sinorhizobium mexicanum]QLL62153.1 allantoinase AllB [Sinorhizobium mexicanum]